MTSPPSLAPLRRRRAVTNAGWLLATIAVLALAGARMPNGLPFGVILLGAVLGGLSALTAMGLVLIYRSTRIINFAQAEIGGLAASVAVVAVSGWHLPYVVAVLIGVTLAGSLGWLIDATVVRRFFQAPRLILTVATIGLAQILGAAQLVTPSLATHLNPFGRFTTPFTIDFTVGPLVFTGDHVLAMAVIPIVMGALGWFFSRSDAGVAVRAAADSNERALLLGIPVRHLSRLTWVLAALLSGIAATLSAPILGANVGAIAGPESLLAPLAAAVIGRMESLPRTALAAVGIGIFQQAVFWSYPRSSAVDVGLFFVIVGALLIQRRQHTRVDDGDLGGYVAVREVRPIPVVLSRLPEVRLTKWLLAGSLAVLLLATPLAMSDAKLVLGAYIFIYGIIALSLVVLTGWAGQISLGQFAFVGVGAATTASLLVHAHTDVFLALLIATGVGSASAVLVGIPALRIQGLFLAVTTLAFAVPVSTYLLNSVYFPTLNPSDVPRPVLLGRISLASSRSLYYFCLVFLLIAVVLVRNYRRSRAGRAMIAIRDNARAGAAYSISPTRAKLVAFAFSGGLAGLAGGLFTIALQTIPFSGFAPISSLVVFTMVVIGGVGSVPGALLGAAYVRGAQYYLHGAAQLLATGAGLLLLLMLVPGGLGEIVFSIRDRVLRVVAARRGLSVPSLAERPTFDPLEPQTSHTVTASVAEAASSPITSSRAQDALISGTHVDARYGQIQVLYDVDLDVRDGEVLALLGTNGAGKSTVLRVLAGLMDSGPGKIMFDGRDITHLSPTERVKAGLVMVPGGRGVFGSLTVAENLRMAGWLSRRDQDAVLDTHARVFELFPRLRERLTVKASLLSGGEQQMLTLAQALLCRPRLLLIDELSLGLAPAVVTSLLDAVRRINADGTTIVLVEQSVNVATSLADRAVFMEKGQVRFSGPVSELTGRDDLLRSVFLNPGNRAPARTQKRTPIADDAPAALEIRDVSRRFGGVQALSGVNLTAGAGRILGVIGSNGAGKTTLFDVCSGFLAADTGAVLLGGLDVTDTSASDRAALGLGRSFQDARLFPSMSVAEALATALERHIEVRDPLACIFGVGAALDSEREVRTRVDELLETMNLQRYRDAFISELSTGTRRIVELAGAVAHNPQVILLDEPSSGIAQKESEALAEVLLALQQRTGATLVLIEHDIPLVSSIADDMACMHLGEVLVTGTPQEVLSHPDVIASYLGTADTAIMRSGLRQPPTPASGPAGSAGSGEPLTVAEYARRHGLSPATVRSRVRAGALTASKTSGRYYIEPARTQHTSDAYAEMEA